MPIAMISTRGAELQDFAQGLGADVEWLGTDEVLAGAAASRWSLVVVDALNMPGGYKTFLNRLLRVNAMLNTVVVTELDEAAFHDDSEGLGVLCAVPARPGREDAVRVMARLEEVLGM